MQFDSTQLLDAFDAIGAAAVDHDVRLELAVDGGSALMLVSNFRFSTEEVDIAELPRPWPQWLSDVTQVIALRNGWSSDWLNEAVSVHLSPLASRTADHLEYGAFPRSAAPQGLFVLVPTPEYVLALKLKAMRMLDPVKGPVETDDIHHLLQLLLIETSDQAIALLGRYFPNSARDSVEQRFLLKHLMPSQAARRRDAPRYGP